MVQNLAMLLTLGTGLPKTLVESKTPNKDIWLINNALYYEKLEKNKSPKIFGGLLKF